MKTNTPQPVQRTEETAKGWIQLRVTMARKNAYVKAARPGKLTAWIFGQLDKAAGYEESK